MIEDELRAAFARHENQAPAAAAVAAAIEEGYRRRRRRGRLRSTGVALAVATTLAVPSIAVAASRHAHHPAVPPAPAVAVPAAKPLNLLILGTDERVPAQGARSDAIIVVHIPATHDRAYVITVPRDTPVSIPGHGTDKVNAAYFYGGADLAEKVVGGLLGVTFDAAAVTTFAGLDKVIDAAGGVDLCVDSRTTSIHIGHTKDGRFATPYRMTGSGMQRVPGVTPEVYDVGCRHFAGWQAVDYVRQRMLIDAPGIGGAQRDKHIRDLLQALVHQVLANPLRIAAVLRVAPQALTVDTGGISLTEWLAVVRAVGSNVRSLEYAPSLGGALRQALAGDDLDAYLAAHPR